MSLFVDIHKNLGSFSLDVSFEAENGITCILGPSGCGKSFTLKCIAGIERPDRGRIELDGTVLFDSEKHIDLPPQKRKVGYLFQNYALFPNMTVRKNIACGLYGEKDAAAKDRKISRILKLMRLEGLEEHKPWQLSGGQQQRTALARILVTEPRILMLDEPFSALDGHLRDALKIELRDTLQRFGQPVLMVTHDRYEAYNMGRKIAVMDNGRILTINNTKTVFADPGSVAAARVTGCKNIAAARKTGEHEVFVPEWGIKLETSAPVREGLEAVGLRAHYFSPIARLNRSRVAYVEEMEEPFETILQFRFADQAPDSPPVWWRLPKDKKPAAFPEELGIAPQNVLLLYKTEDQ